MTSKTSGEVDLGTLADDVAVLKRDIAALMDHIKSGGASAAKDAARERLEKISEEARHLYRNIATDSERAMKAIGHQVEEQPLMSLAIAFGIGLISGRLLSR